MSDTVVTMKLAVKQVNVVLDELRTCESAHKQASISRTVSAKEKQFHRQRTMDLRIIIEQIEG